MPKKSTKKQQDTYTMPDNQLEMGFSEGITYSGSDDGMQSAFSYSFGDLGQLTFPEEDMREKYPALKQAWEHYKNVLDMCYAQEQEETKD